MHVGFLRTTGPFGEAYGSLLPLCLVGATSWEEELDLSRGIEDKLEPVKTYLTDKDQL